MFSSVPRHSGVGNLLVLILVVVLGIVGVANPDLALTHQNFVAFDPLRYHRCIAALGRQSWVR